MSTKKIHAQPPKKLTGIELEKIPSSAAGFSGYKISHYSNKRQSRLKKRHWFAS